MNHDEKKALLCQIHPSSTRSNTADSPEAPPFLERKPFPKNNINMRQLFPHPNKRHQQQSSRLWTRPVTLLMALVVIIFVVNLNRMSRPPRHQHTSSSSSENNSNNATNWKWRTMTPNPTTASSTTTIVSTRSSSSTVMGFATGYDLHIYKRFVGSLRKTGYSGHIILAVDPSIDIELQYYLTSKNVTMKKVEYVECSTQLLNASDITDAHGKEMLSCVKPYLDLKARWGRFPFLRDALEECETCTGPVLISDVRDTFFQADPFGPDAPDEIFTDKTGEGGGLQVFEEDPRIRTTNWLVEWPVRECKGISFDEPMLCSGTTVGTRMAMLQYLKAMHDEMKEWMKDPKCHFKINGDDQSIHNYLFYTGRLPFAKAIPNRMGIVNTVGAQALAVETDHAAYAKAKGISEYEARVYPYRGTNLTKGTWVSNKFGLTDHQGYFTNKNGERSCVIHQYDRFGYQLERWFWKFPGFKD